MRIARISFLICCGFLTPCSHGMGQEDVALRFAFAKAAQRDGDPYVVARQVLESQVESILPLLNEKARSSDWREWSLAKALQIRIQEPQKSARWRWAIRNWRQDLKIDPQGHLVTTLSDEVVKAAALEGERLTPGEVELEPEALPIVVDVLRESPSTRGNSERILAQSLIALKHWRDPKAVGPLLNYYPISDEVVETLAALGQPALPELHAALKSASAPWPRPLQASLASKVLGEIGNESSARLLIKAIPELTMDAIRADFCQAIGQLKPPEGPDVLFHELQQLAFARGTNRRDLDRDAYLRVRSALLDYGAAAKPALASYLRPGVSVETRAMAAGILHELSEPDNVTALYQQAAEQWNVQQGAREQAREFAPEDIVTWGRRLFWTRFYGATDFPPPALLETVPAPLLVEIAVATREEPLIERLSVLKEEELSFEALKWLLSSDQSRWATRRGAILPLAEVAGVRAVPPLREFLKEHPLTELDRVIEAAILIGDRKAGEFLEALLEHPQAQRRFETDLREKRATIQSIAQVLNSEPLELAKLLELEDPTLRFAAARILAKQGDPRGVGVLFAALMEAAGGDPRHALPRQAHQAQNAIVRMGRPALEAIDKAASTSHAKHADLLAEVLKLRITRPDLDQKVQHAMHRRQPGWAKRSGPSLADFQSAGQEIAKLVGEEAVPLLEASVLWPGHFSPTLAAFALANFQQDRSLEIVAAHAGQIRWGGAALKEFGEMGIAAAKQVPAPDPNQPQFGMRRGRNREATTALTMADEAQGVEGILAVLKLAAEGKIPSEKTNAYLKLAANYKEERLIPAIVEAVGKQGSDVAYTALHAAQPYEDERLLPVYLRFVGETGSTGDLALQGIVRLQGEKTVRFLLDQLEEARDEAIRLGIIQALPMLRTNSRWFVKTKLSEEDLDQQVPEIRAALIEQLKAKEETISSQAAESLATFMVGRRDKAAIEALVKWMVQADAWPPAVTHYIVWTKEPSIAPALLPLYQQDPLNRTALAAYFAEIKYQPATKVVVAALEKRLEENEMRSNFPEVEILAKYGETGQDALWEFLKEPQDLQFRVLAYETLSRHSHDDRAFEPAAELLQQLIRNGLWDPELRAWYHRGRSDMYVSYLSSLADSLLALDSRRAYPILALGCLEANEANVQGRLAWSLINLQTQHPEYRKEKIPLDEIEPPPTEGDAEVPLLKACELWHEIVTRHRGQFPNAVRERLIAMGEEALQVGVELFYDWPTPTKREIEQALAHLTHDEEAIRREAAAVLALRKYPAKDLDQALADATGETLARGNAIRRWRETGGGILDVHLTERTEFTNLLLADWPIDPLRKFTIRNLDRLASIPNEAYMWSQKPLFPMLLSVRYSPDASERILLKAFTKNASPEARKISSSVEQSGVGGFTLRSADRWGALPSLVPSHHPPADEVPE